MQVEFERIVVVLSARKLPQFGHRVFGTGPGCLAGQIDILRESAAAGPDQQGVPTEQHPRCVVVLKDTAEEDRENVLLSNRVSRDAATLGLVGQLGPQ